MASPSTAFLDAVAHRRTVYQLTKKSPIADSKILDIVGVAARHVPSSFDSQTTRIVVLLGAEHDRFWSTFTWDALQLYLPNEEAKKGSKGRIDGFAGAYGTILFFESGEALKTIQEKQSLYKDKFPQWSEHTSAMHQYVLWTALELEGFGASLQHYNPLVDEKVKSHYKLDGDWEMKAQLVFGGLPEGKKREELLLPKQPEGRDKKYVKVFGN